MLKAINELGSLFARQWIAGTKESDAIHAGIQINAQGKSAIFNYLGENFKDPKKIENSVRIYFDIFKLMKQSGVKGSVSIKPSQLGLLVSDQLFYKNYLRIVSHASKLGYYVWVDAEEYEYIDRTHGIVIKMLKKHKNTGIGIQTKLRRSLRDAQAIAKHGGLIRLVKGAYAEPEERAYNTKEEIRANYLHIMETLFRKKARLMVATHDDYLIFKALSLQKKYKHKAMFAMLKGIRGNLANELARSGEDMHIYIPFGEEWFEYSVRRMKEGHTMLLLRSIFQQ
ncbi:MAG: proline dehydrogenase family protein [Candidatus Micrarchaeota archaeon]|nr:proline dehydrogenase family protein [Candidatus Micrarchaeota archaeon]